MSSPLLPEESLQFFEAASHGILYELASTAVAELGVADYLIDSPQQLLWELNRLPPLPSQIHEIWVRYAYIPNEIRTNIGVRYR